MAVHDQKQVIALNAASTTNAATATGVVDRLGWDYMTLDVITTTSNDTTNNPSVLKLQHSDTTDATNYADISGTVGDSDWTIPAAVTSGNWGVKFNVDCRALSRYIRVQVSPVTTQTITAIANLSKGAGAAIDATSSGANALIEV